MKKSVSLVLLATILLQSCVVYQKTPVPLSESYDKGNVKVITKTDKKLQFNKIIQKDSLHYGFNRKKLKNDYGEFEWVEYREYIDESMIESIYLKNGTKSGWATAGLLVGLTVGAFAIPILVGFFAYLFGGG